MQDPSSKSTHGQSKLGQSEGAGSSANKDLSHGDEVLQDPALDTTMKSPSSIGTAGTAPSGVTFAETAPLTSEQTDGHSQLVGIVLGEFELVECIGSGSFGDVYRAKQHSLDREAVVKVARHSAESEDAVEQFLREAKLASQLDHPYAAHIYAFGHDRDQHILWIAMEFIRGIELHDYLKRHQPLPLEQLVAIFEPICEVVHTAHEIGIVHRDLKPTNIMLVERAGRRLPKLLDFGVAKLRSPSAEPDFKCSPDQQDSTSPPGTALVGTPAYMSPEQWRDSDAVDPRSDIYSLGIILYESITGHHPFTEETLKGFATAHQESPVPPMGARVPQTVIAVVEQALAKDPAQRFENALLFSNALVSASGVNALRSFRLPQQAERLRRRWAETAPQPIAECLSLMRAARSEREARELLATTSHTIAQYIGQLALSSASRLGWDAVRANPRFNDTIIEWDRRGFNALDWLTLAREICRPFVTRAQAFPLPALLALTFTKSGEERSLPDGVQRLIERSSAPGRRNINTSLSSALSDLAELLLFAEFVLKYPLIVAKDGLPELWIGTRNPRRQVAHVRHLPDDDRATLFDQNGSPILDLHPFVKILEPADGQPDELFLFDGITDGRARLVAQPVGYEIFDQDVWSRLREQWTLNVPELSDSEELITPFRGLNAFRPKDAQFFYGRERESNRVRNQLRQQSFIAVVGASGSGKSSFVYAGVVAQLPSTWRTHSLRPGIAPLSALAGLLHDLQRDIGERPTHEHSSNRLPLERIDACIRDNPTYFGDMMHELSQTSGDTLLVVVDQLEELFTLSTNTDDQLKFCIALMSAARSPTKPVRVIVTLRDDFLARAGQLSPFKGRIARNLCLLSTPDETHLRRIVTEPLRRLGYKLEESTIADDIVAEVADRPGALPLISFAAAELWELRDRHFKKLTRGAYDSIGGVVGSLARYAERELDTMSASEQRVVREVFRHLITSEGTRAMVGRAELLSALKNPGNNGTSAHVVERLLSARLLVSADREDGEHIEIIHEALLSAWPRLLEWRREDGDSARLLDQLRAAAKQWSERGRPNGLLWRGDALAEYRVWRTRFTGNLTALEAEFSRASVAEETRSRRIRSVVTVAIIAVLAAALIAVLWMYQQTQDRLYASYEDSGRRELVSGRPIRALKILEQSYRAGRSSVPLRFALARASSVLDRIDMNLHGHERTVFFGATTTDNSQLMTTDASGLLCTWDTASGNLLHRFKAHDTGIARFVVTPNWSTMATADINGVVRLWDVRTKAMLREFTHGESLTTLALSASGRYLATKSQAGAARVWDVHSEQPTISLKKNRLYASNGGAAELAFCDHDRLVVVGAPDGHLYGYAPTGEMEWSIPAHPSDIEQVECARDRPWVISSGSDHDVRVWNIATQELMHTFPHPAALRDVTLAPSGELLLSLDGLGSARLWDLNNGELQNTLTHRHEAILEAVFDAKSRRILTVGITVAVWNVEETSVPAAVFPDHGSKIRRAYFLGQDKLYTLSEDSSVRVWRAHDPHILGTWRHGANVTWTLATAPEGDLVGVGFDDHVARLYTPRGKLVASLEQHTDIVSGITFDHTGKRIATGSYDRTVRLWSRDGDLQRTLSGHKDDVKSVMFSPDGHRLLSASLDGTAKLWDVESGALIHTMAPGKGEMSQALFDATGERIATVNGPNIIFWDAQSGAHMTDIQAHGLVTFVARFSSDGRFLATAGEAATGKVWSADTGELVSLLEGHSSYIYGMDFGYGGDVLATSGYDHMLMFWDPETGALIDKLDMRDQLFTIDFSDDSDVLAAMTGKGLVRTWHLPLEHRSASELSNLLHTKTR